MDLSITGTTDTSKILASVEDGIEFELRLGCSSSSFMRHDEFQRYSGHYSGVQAPTASMRFILIISRERASESDTTTISIPFLDLPIPGGLDLKPLVKVLSMVKRNVLKKNTLALRYDDDFIQIESSTTLRNALHSFVGLTPEEVEDLFDDGDITIGRIKTVRVEKECILRILGGSLHRILASESGQPWDEVKYRLLKLFSHHTRMRDVILRVLDKCVGKEVRVTIFSESLNTSFYLDNDGLLQVNEQKNDRVARVGGSIYRKRCSSWERYSRQTKEFERLEPLLVDGKPQFYADGTPKIVVKSYKKVQVVWMPVDEHELHLLTASKHTDQG